MININLIFQQILKSKDYWKGKGGPIFVKEANYLWYFVLDHGCAALGDMFIPVDNNIDLLSSLLIARI